MTQRTDVRLVGIAERNAVGGVKNVAFFWMRKEKPDAAVVLAMDSLSWATEFSTPRCRDGFAAIVVSHKSMNAVVVVTESSHYDETMLVQCGQEAIDVLVEYPHADKETLRAMIQSSAQQLVPVVVDPPPGSRDVDIHRKWTRKRLAATVGLLLFPCVAIPGLVFFLFM